MKPEDFDEKYIDSLTKNFGSIIAKQDLEIKSLSQDAKRYRILRDQHWSDGRLAVVQDPKRNVRLGTFCPSGSLLDEFIDEIAGITN